MAGIELQIDLDGLAPALSQLNRLGAEMPAGDVLANIGALVESQTRRRVSSDKTAPDGTPWPAWSPAYSATRRQAACSIPSHGSKAMISSLSDRTWSTPPRTSSARPMERMARPRGHGSACQVKTRPRFQTFSQISSEGCCNEFQHVS